MPFAPKFEYIPQDLKNRIILKARQTTPSTAAREFFQEAGMSKKGLETQLRKLIAPEKKEENTPQPKLRWNQKPKEPERELSEEEIDMLGKLERGEIGITEMSRIVAKHVFEKMLKNPGDFRFIDFFRAELLRQKDEENKIKDRWAQEVINRMFAGKLPPRICPNCGFDLVPDSHVLDTPSLIEGEEVSDA